MTTSESAEIRKLKAENRRLREDNEILRAASILRRGARPPQPLIVAFIDDQRAQGHAVESICRVLREQGLEIAARTYRAWRKTNQAVAGRTVSDASWTRSVTSLGPPTPGVSGSWPQKGSTGAAR